MAHKKKGHLTTSPEWAKHLRKYMKNQFWKGERNASKELIRTGLKELNKGQTERKFLPKEVLQKAIISGKEYGWKRTDFKEVVDKAVEVGLGIIGGQVQFKLPDGTCELYWHKYDTTERKSGENWKEYCQRTKEECLSQFEKLPTENELIKEGIESFEFLKEKSKYELSDFLIFILYFNDSETEQEK